MRYVVFQAEDARRDLVRSRGLGDVYKRQAKEEPPHDAMTGQRNSNRAAIGVSVVGLFPKSESCLLYTSDAADERSSVDLGGRRFIKKKKQPHSQRDSRQRH